MVVIGLGSPFLSDDSVGPRVVRRLAEQGLPNVRLVEAHAGGLLLLEELNGARRAVIIDALLDERRTAGEIHLANSTWQPATPPAVMTAVCRKPVHWPRPGNGAAGGSSSIHLLAIVAGM